MNTSQFISLKHTSPINLQRRDQLSTFKSIQKRIKTKIILFIRILLLFKFILFLSGNFFDEKFRPTLFFKLLRGDLIMHPKELLWEIRTTLPMLFVLEELESTFGIPFKLSEGFTRFLCPSCSEMQSTINPKNNLAHCFCCGKNLNNIDFVISQGRSFKESVEILICLQNKYQHIQKIKTVRPKLNQKPDVNKPHTK